LDIFIPKIVRGQSARQTAKDVLVAQGVRFESHFVLGPLHVFLRDPLFAQLKTLLAFTKDFAGWNGICGHCRYFMCILLNNFQPSSFKEICANFWVVVPIC
jgi:hypothetical protein